MNNIHKIMVGCDLSKYTKDILEVGQSCAQYSWVSSGVEACFHGTLRVVFKQVS